MMYLLYTARGQRQTHRRDLAVFPDEASAIHIRNLCTGEFRECKRRVRRTMRTEQEEWRVKQNATTKPIPFDWEGTAIKERFRKEVLTQDPKACLKGVMKYYVVPVEQR